MTNRIRITAFASIAIALTLTGCVKSFQNEKVTPTNIQDLISTEVSLAQAIKIAREHVSGTPSEIVAKTTSSGPVYVVKVISKSSTKRVTINANTGVVVSSKFKWNQQAKRQVISQKKYIERSTLTLEGAIGLAEQQSKGKAISATVDHAKYPRNYEITILKDLRTSTVTIPFSLE